MGLDPNPSAKKAVTNSIGCPVRQPPMDLDINCLYGSPLIEELANLIAATIAYHIAKKESLTFTPPKDEFRTPAGLKELLQFALLDKAKPHIRVFAMTALFSADKHKIDEGLDFAKIAANTYFELQGVLADGSSRDIPTKKDILEQIRASSREVAESELRTFGI